MTTILFCILLAILVNLPVVLRARHKQRYAQAKLEITRTLTEMESLMLSGELKLGDVCHDHIYQSMLRSQYASRYIVPWKFWKKPSNFAEMRKRLHEEMSKGTKLSKLLVRYGDAHFRAFRYNRPIASAGFVAWVLLFAGGLGVLLIGLLSIFTAQKAVGSFKKLASESYVICDSKMAEA